MPTNFKAVGANGISDVTPILTCPSGTEITINSILLTNLSGSPSTVIVDVDRDGTIYTVLGERSLADKETYPWDGVINLEYLTGVGDILKITPSATMDVWVSYIKNT